MVTEEFELCRGQYLFADVRHYSQWLCHATCGLVYGVTPLRNDFTVCKTRAVDVFHVFVKAEV